MTYHLVQLGCQMNHSDGERIAAVLESMGMTRAVREEDATLLGMVACSVRQKAIDRVYTRISLWNTWKASRNILTFVSGCILPEDHDKFLERFDLVFSINELPQVPGMIATYGVPLSMPAVGDRLEAARLLAEQLTVEPRHNPDHTHADLTTETGATGPAAGLEPDTIGPVRPSGPLWLKEAPGISLSFGSLPGEAHTSARKMDQARLQRLSGLSALKLIQSEGINGTPGPGHAGQSPAATDLPPSAPQAHSPMDAFWHIKPAYQSRFDASIPIQNGCDKFCTFCAVPYTRGREVSRPREAILAELTHLVDQGYKTITLLGQNVNSWGKDGPDQVPGFASLLDDIGRIGQEQATRGRRFWVYFTSPHPRDMDRSVLEVMARWPVLAKQVHLPLQSGDDKLLLRMNRAHGMERYRRIVADIRSLMPGATLFTDIIVGFSGESEAQFDNTRLAMEEFRYQMAFVSPYSPRPGAAASRWEDDVPHSDKKRRLAVLTEILHRTSRAFNEGLVGQEVDVVVNGADPGGKWLSSYTEGKINLRFAPPPGIEPVSLVGTFARVRVTTARDMSLEGQWLASGELAGRQSGELTGAPA